MTFGEKERIVRSGHELQNFFDPTYNFRNKLECFYHQTRELGYDISWQGEGLFGSD